MVVVVSNAEAGRVSGLGGMEREVGENSADDVGLGDERDGAGRANAAGTDQGVDRFAHHGP